MKNYYFNPKTQDLHIFDTESKEILVLERIEGIRVLTSSEIDHPTNFTEGDPARERRGKDPDTRFKKGERGFSKKRKAKTPKPAKKGGKWRCKNCGELGHGAKTCKNPPKVSPPPDIQ